MRWAILLATFLLSVLLYVDRICISVAGDAVARDLALSEKQLGWVFSAFSLGYALLQTPAGWLADRFGPRRVLAAIVTAWSAFTGLTAAANSFVSMLAVRFLFGAGEAGAFPGMSRAVFSWFPIGERGRVQAVNFSGSRVGAAATLPLISWLVVAAGWRPTFVVLMLVGFVWAAVWYLVFRDDPAQVKWLSESERRYIAAGRSAPLANEASPPAETGFWKRLAASRTIWALCGQYFASNFVFYFALTWYFPQLKARYDLTGVQASLFAAAPLVCGAIGCWVSGWWIDGLYASHRWVVSRRLPSMVGFALAAAGLIGTAYAQSPLTSSIWFSLSVFGADMTLPTSWSTCVDVGRSRSGVVSGTMNMAGNLGSFLTSLAFPYLLEWTGSPLPYFFVAAGLCLLSIGLWGLIDPRKPLEFEG